MRNNIIARVLERLGKAEPRVSKGYGAGHVKRSRATGKNLGSTIDSFDKDESNQEKSSPVKISRAFTKSDVKDALGNYI